MKKYKIYEIGRRGIDMYFSVKEINTTPVVEQMTSACNSPHEITEHCVFTGRISECESYIRLKEGGYFE
jgi:hypothetical protein